MASRSEVISFKVTRNYFPYYIQTHIALVELKSLYRFISDCGLNHSGRSPSLEHLGSSQSW